MGFNDDDYLVDDVDDLPFLSQGALNRRKKVTTKQKRKVYAVLTPSEQRLKEHSKARREKKSRGSK